MKVIVRSFSKRPRLVLVRDAFRKSLEVNQMLKPNFEITLDVEPGKEIWLASDNLFSFDDDKDRLITIRDSVEGAGVDAVFQIEVIPQDMYRTHWPKIHEKGIPPNMYGSHWMERSEKGLPTGYTGSRKRGL